MAISGQGNQAKPDLNIEFSTGSTRNDPQATKLLILNDGISHGDG